jgi:hypothetical protein
MLRIVVSDRSGAWHRTCPFVCRVEVSSGSWSRRSSCWTNLSFLGAGTTSPPTCRARRSPYCIRAPGNLSGRTISRRFPDGAHPPGGERGRGDRDPGGDPRHLQPLAPDASLPGAATGTGGRHALADLLQVRRRQPRGQPQAERGSRPGALQPAGGTDSALARSHGLGSESDDPHALRHIYATLRIAAQHPTLYIESSMGTGLVGKVYGGVIRRYEGKGPLNIDAEIEAARNAALAKRRRLRTA